MVEVEEGSKQIELILSPGLVLFGGERPRGTGVGGLRGAVLKLEEGEGGWDGMFHVFLYNCLGMS